MKRIVLLFVLSISVNLSFGQKIDNVNHIVSYSEIDTGVRYHYGGRTETGEKLFNKAPATIATIFQEFIERYGESEFNRIINLSFNDFKKDLHSEENPVKKIIMRMVYDYNWKTDGLRFRYNGDIYVITYEPSYGNQIDDYYSRDLNLYKWEGSYKWTKVNNRPIPYGFYHYNSPTYMHSISTRGHQKFSVMSKNYPKFKHDLIGILVDVDAKDKRLPETQSHNIYTELFLFIKTPNGFDIRVKKIKPIIRIKEGRVPAITTWSFNSDLLPSGENYIGTKDEHTIYLHLRSGTAKQDGMRRKTEQKFGKVEYNIITDEFKFIER